MGLPPGSTPAMSFLRRLPLILRRIPPLLRGASLGLRDLWRQVPPPGRRSRPALAVQAILTALLLGAVLLCYRTVAVADSQTSGSAARTSVVTKGRVTATVTAPGTVQSGSMANLGFAAPGLVTDVNVKVGDKVKKDQVLAKVNSPQAQEQLSAAKSTLATAQKSLTKVKSSTSDATTIAFAQAQVTTAQNSVSAAERAVNGTTLTAPFEGTVITVNGTVGSSWSGLTPGGSTPGVVVGAASDTGTFIQLADLDKLQVSAYFPEVDAIKLKAGQPAMATWAAQSRAEVVGRLATVAPAASIQNNVNSYPVAVILQWLPDGIRIGQTVNVKVTVAETDGVLRVPTAVVHSGESGYTAEVVRSDGTRETRAVEVGLRGDEFVEIKSGLRLNEVVSVDRGEARGNR
jgi:macrolide-specific efflux system membrane fusion protein